MATAEGFPLIDQTSALSLGLVLVLIGSAYALSVKVVPPATPKSLHVLFVWHAFDALIHFIFEGSYLYNCFFTYAPAVPSSSLVVTNFLGRPDRTYGSYYGTNPFAQLWQVYARADKRWGGADPTVIALELLTVLGGGPLAVWICVLIARRNPMVGFWITTLAVAELYGGFITFAPEWLTGNLNLDSSNFMHLWVYLVFFNMLWVFFPLYAIKVAYDDMANAYQIRNKVVVATTLRSKEGKKAV